MVKDSLEIINSDLYSFLEMSIITFFQESCLGIGKQVAGTRKWLKISFLSLHEDISGTECRIGINEKTF